MNNKPDQYIVVVGCGRLGSILANKLSRDGHSVVVIDQAKEAFENLSPEYTGFRLEGDATELDVLRQAKMDRADAVIATTWEDNVNLMVAQTAKKVCGIPCVIARVFDPHRQALYRLLEVETICPTSMAAEAFLKHLQPVPAND